MEVGHRAASGGCRPCATDLDTFLGQWPKYNVHAVVVVRRGKLAFERYFRGRDRRWVLSSGVVQFSPTRKHDIRSIAKSVTSLLIGVAVSEERFPALDSSVVDFFPEYVDLRTTENARTTFRHLNTMTHGLQWDETARWRDPANNERGLLEAKDPYRYVLEQPMALPPGAAFNYSGGATSLLGAALAKAVGKRIDLYAAQKLFEPLGITDFEWLCYTGSAEIAAFSALRLRPRDLAKLGQLVANDGRWNGKQVVRACWIDESTKPHVNVEALPEVPGGGVAPMAGRPRSRVAAGAVMCCRHLCAVRLSSACRWPSRSVLRPHN